MSKSNSSGGIGVTGCLLILFITLKLLGVIHWSWWWVLAPLWMSTGLVLGIVGICLLVWLTIWACSEKK